MNWEKIGFEEIVWFQEGPGVRNTQFRDSGVKLLNVGNINNNNVTLSSTKIYISEQEAFGKYKHFLVDEGDLIIASSGVTLDTFHKKIAWVNKEHLPLCMNTSTIRFKPKDKSKLSIIYFSYFLRTPLFNTQLRKLITGSAQLNFGPSHLKQMWIPLPPLPIQQQIADTLDKADALRRKDQELVEKYDELAQAVFYEMFGDIKSRTKNWDWTSLDSVLEDIVAGSSVGGEDKVLQNGELGVLKISAVTSGKFLKDEYKVPDQRLLPKNLIYPQKGDLLFSRANTRELVGATAIVESDCRNVFLPDKLWKLKPKPSVNSVYLKFVLSEPSIKYELTKTATGTSGSMLNISMTKLRSLNIPLPNIDIQDSFAARIKMLNQVIKNAHKIKKLSDGLFESLLTRIR